MSAFLKPRPADGGLTSVHDAALATAAEALAFGKSLGEEIAAIVSYSVEAMTTAARGRGCEVATVRSPRNDDPSHCHHDMRGCSGSQQEKISASVARSADFAVDLLNQD